MKGLKYRYKYLLYPGAQSRFTRREAERLAENPSELEALLADLATRSEGYGAKVWKQFHRYPQILEAQILKLKDVLWGVQNYSPRSAGPSGTPSSMRQELPNSDFGRFLQGGAPGLGKKA